MGFEEEVKEIIKEAINRGYESKIPLSVIKTLAILNKKSLISSYRFKNWFLSFLDVANFLNLGHYNENQQVFVLNETNEEIIKMVLEHFEKIKSKSGPNEPENKS